MSEPVKKDVFLENDVYRRNRLIDAARMLPLLGFILFIMPAVMVVGAAPTAPRWIFLFVAWVLLIVASALIARALQRSESDGEAKD